MEGHIHTTNRTILSLITFRHSHYNVSTLVNNNVDPEFGMGVFKSTLPSGKPKLKLIGDKDGFDNLRFANVALSHPLLRVFRNPIGSKWLEALLRGIPHS